MNKKTMKRLPKVIHILKDLFQMMNQTMTKILLQIVTLYKFQIKLIIVIFNPNKKF
jgi:flagellin-specific chaperone FliS